MTLPGDYVDAHARCDSLSHVPNGKATQLRYLFYLLYHQVLCRPDLDDGCIACFDEVWVGLFYLTGFVIKLCLDFRESACDLRSVRMEHGRVARSYRTWMLQNDDLGRKFLCDIWWRVLMTGDIAALNILLSNAPDVETYVIPWSGLWDLFVMHFY